MEKTIEEVINDLKKFVKPYEFGDIKPTKSDAELVLKLHKKGMSYNDSLAMALVVFFNSH